MTGTFTDGSGNPLGGSVSFTPSQELVSPSGEVIIAKTAVTALVSGSTGEMAAVSLACTDNPGLFPPGWTWVIAVSVPGAVQSYSVYLPSVLGSSADLSSLNPAGSPPSSTATYVISVNGQSGVVTGVPGPGSVSASAQALVNSSVIVTGSAVCARVSAAAFVTGAILAPGAVSGQVCTVINESGNSITFAAAGISNVADGASDVIAGNTARAFTWDGAVLLWYRSALSRTPGGGETDVGYPVHHEPAAAGFRADLTDGGGGDAGTGPRPGWRLRRYLILEARRTRGELSAPVRFHRRIMDCGPVRVSMTTRCCGACSPMARTCSAARSARRSGTCWSTWTGTGTVSAYSAMTGARTASSGRRAISAKEGNDCRGS